MAVRKSKGRTWEEAASADPLAKYYIVWYRNCLESIKWLASSECPYPWDKVEWLVDYYEQKAVIHWCEAVKAGVVE